MMHVPEAQEAAELSKVMVMVEATATEVVKEMDNMILTRQLHQKLLYRDSRQRKPRRESRGTWLSSIILTLREQIWITDGNKVLGIQVITRLHKQLNCFDQKEMFLLVKNITTNTFHFI
jgi:hypothetical protein